MSYPMDIKEDGYNGHVPENMLGDVVFIHPHTTDQGLHIVSTQKARVYDGGLPNDVYFAREDNVPVVFPGGKNFEFVKRRFVRGL